MNPPTNIAPERSLPALTMHPSDNRLAHLEAMVETLMISVGRTQQQPAPLPAPDESTRRIDHLEGLISSISSIQQCGIEAQQTQVSLLGRAADAGQMSQLTDSIDCLAIQSPSSDRVYRWRPFTASDI